MKTIPEHIESLWAQWERLMMALSEDALSKADRKILVRRKDEIELKLTSYYEAEYESKQKP
jgi:hypothetical protein